MKGTASWGVLQILLILNAGCIALPAGKNQMTVTPPEIEKIRATTSLHDNINVKGVSGGKKTNPFWKSQIGSEEFRGALENSLMLAGLLERNTGEGRYLISADIMLVDQPWFGASMTVTTSVKYVVVDKKTNNELYSGILKALYTAKTSDSLIGVYRLQLANEGSARENIRMIIERLLEMNVSQGDVGMP